MPRRLAFLVTFIVVATVAPAAAQAGPATGSRVRLTAPTVSADLLVGRVAAATLDSLLLSVGDGAATVSLEKRAIDRLQVSRGRARFRWAVLGAGAGFFGGALIGGAIGSHDDPSGWGGLTGTIAGAAAGLPLGALAGGIFAPERWVEYPLPRAVR